MFRKSLSAIALALGGCAHLAIPAMALSADLTRDLNPFADPHCIQELLGTPAAMGHCEYFRPVGDQLATGPLVIEPTMFGSAEFRLNPLLRFCNAARFTRIMDLLMEPHGLARNMGPLGDPHGSTSDMGPLVDPHN